MATRGGDSPQAVLSGLLVDIARTWRRYGLGRLFASTLALGLEHRTLGPAFVEELLEPLLQAVEQLLATFVDNGDLPPTDVRAAALSLASPVILALLHQDNLHGAHCRPLDVEQFARLHVHTVLHGLLARPVGIA
jgi:AcrR family transcriptional regulator